MNNNISFGPLLTPARDIRKRSKAVNTFQLTIKNRLGAALKFANGCDNNLALGVEAIKVIENDSSGAQSSEYVPCPLCCRENLPLSQFGNMIPSDDDSSAAAHYMFCCRPSSNHNQLHWHTQHCYLCQGLLVDGNVDSIILDANEKYRQLERHRIRRSLNTEEMCMLKEISQIWMSYLTNIQGDTHHKHHSHRKTHRKHSHSKHHHGKVVPSSDFTSNEALCSLNLAHFYFMGFGNDTNESFYTEHQSQQSQQLGQSQYSQFGQSQHSSQGDKPDIKHMDKVIKHTKRAARYGLPCALFNLSMLYLWGYINDSSQGTEKQSKRGETGSGIKCLRKACEMDYMPAHYHMALLIREGVSEAVRNDEECNKQDIYDMHKIDDMYKYKPNDNLINLENSVTSDSEMGSTKTSVIKYDITTELLMKDKSLSKSSKKPSKHSKQLHSNQIRALYLLLLLVIKGFRDSCLDAGILLSKNIICPLNREMKSILGLKSSVNCWHRAFIVWCKGAKLGCVKCTFQIASCYKRGLGVSRSSSLAFQCYSKAAAMGSEQAKHELDILKSDNVHLNQDEHFYANKWKAIENAINNNNKRDNRSENYQSIGGVGVVRDGLVGVTADIHHHHHHHQSEWQPWFKQEHSNSLVQSSQNINKNKVGDIWSSIESEKCDVNELLFSRSKHLESQRKNMGTYQKRRPDYYKHKHGEVLAEIIHEAEEEENRNKDHQVKSRNEMMFETLNDGIERFFDAQHEERTFETKFIPPNSKYQQNFQKLFGCYDDLQTATEIVPFKTR